MRVPDKRVAPRDLARNQKCLCGSGKKSKKCCFHVVRKRYLDSLEKYIPNLGKKSY